MLPLPAACAPAFEKLLKNEFRRDYPEEPERAFFKIRAPLLHLTWQR